MSEPTTPLPTPTSSFPLATTPEALRKQVQSAFALIRSLEVRLASTTSLLRSAQATIRQLLSERTTELQAERETNSQLTALVEDLETKLSREIRIKARAEIQLGLLKDLLGEGPDLELSPSCMEHWGPTQDKLREVLVELQTLRSQQL